MIECATVEELIQVLRGCKPDAIVHTTQPPFTGVRIIPQQPGAYMIAAPKEQTPKAQE